MHGNSKLTIKVARETVEHNIPKEQQQEPPRRRPDLATFFSTLDLVDTSGDRQPQNAHSLPLPQDISAAFVSRSTTHTSYDTRERRRVC